MSVPLDNLYHWIESMLPTPATIYLFYPHGSKNISDFDWLNDYDFDTAWQFPAIILHDQEPLNWNFYNQPDQYLDFWSLKELDNSNWENLRNTFYANFNLKAMSLMKSGPIYDRTILIHSEKNSADLEKYEQNGFISVHYWAHAVIARDWYRFAEHDTKLHTKIEPQNKFLIYCRDWSNQREYRLKFLELLVQYNLDQVSQTSIMHTNSDNVSFLDYEFLNPKFKLNNPTSILQIPNNKFSSTASANYDPGDFIRTEISVVLETIVNDSRVHLTEKTLRPIACGHPFILAAGPGALDYIRNYGFKTFAPWIDESYDQETDSLRRLEKIIESMKQIQNLQGQELVDFRREIKKIAEFNKMHFFSDEFFNAVKLELKNNLDNACSQVTQTQGKHYLELLRLMKIQKNVFPKKERVLRTKFLRQLRQSCRGSQTSHQEDPPA